MFFKAISYFQFLLKSTNQHGVHSPFVYDFITKGLYKKISKKRNFEELVALKNLSKKEKKILSKILFYFKIDTINFDKTVISKTLDESFKLLYINNICKLNLFDFKDFNSNDFIIIKDIHQNKKSNQEWREIIKNKTAIVTIDLFYFGIIFFRKEQAKEHFIIRV